MNDYFDLDGYLRGDGWELDEWGIATPPGTRNDGLHVIEGGPQHATNPHPFYFVTRSQPNRLHFTTFQQVSGMEVRKDGVYRLGPEPGQRTKLEWKEATMVRQQMIDAFGPEIARAAGIEPE